MTKMFWFWVKSRKSETVAVFPQSAMCAAYGSNALFSSKSRKYNLIRDNMFDNLAKSATYRNTL